MKKLVISAVILVLLLSGCINSGRVRIKYTVVYPDTVLTIDSIYDYSWVSEDLGSIWICRYPRLGSDEGTNYIILGRSRIIETSCPLRIEKCQILE